MKVDLLYFLFSVLYILAVGTRSKHGQSFRSAYIQVIPESNALSTLL